MQTEEALTVSHTWRKTLSSAAGVVILMLCAAQAQAFDRDGLKGGMTVDESLQVLRQAGSLTACEGRLHLYAPAQSSGMYPSVGF